MQVQGMNPQEAMVARKLVNEIIRNQYKIRVFAEFDLRSSRERLRSYSSSPNTICTLFINRVGTKCVAVEPDGSITIIDPKKNLMGEPVESIVNHFQNLMIEKIQKWNTYLSRVTKK